MPEPARNVCMRVEQLIAECSRLEYAMSDAAQTLQRAAEVLNAEVEGASIAEHKPLQELHRAGKLAEVLTILEALARRPDYTEAVYELVHGSNLEVVAKCLPR